MPSREGPSVDAFLHAVATYQGQDPSQMGALLSPDVILWMSGRSFLAGRYRGWEEVLEFGQASGQIVDMSTIVLEDVTTDDHEVRAVITADVIGPGDARLRVRSLPRMHFDSEGRILDIWCEIEDQEAFDRFLEGVTRPPE